MPRARPSRVECAEPVAFARLSRRLEALGYPVAEVETREGRYALLVDRGGPARAAIVSAELARRVDGKLGGVLRTLRDLAPSRPLVPLVFGTPTSVAARGRMRKAGIELALGESLDTHVLRFQVNRALASGGPLPVRVARRAPLEHAVAVRRRLRSRSIPVYTISARGAFLLTDRPLAPGRRLWLEVPVGLIRPRTLARVVMASRPGASTDPTLPSGMAVVFEDLDGPSTAVINRLVEERLAGLAV